MSSVTLLAAVAMAAGIGEAHSGPGAEVAKTCAPGKIEVVLNKKARCAKSTFPRAVKPHPSGDPVIRMLEDALLTDPVGAAIRKRLKRKQARKLLLRDALTRKALGKNGAQVVLAGVRRARELVREEQGRVSRQQGTPAVKLTVNEATGDYSVGGSVTLPGGTRINITGKGNGKTRKSELGMETELDRIDDTHDMRFSVIYGEDTVPSCPEPDGTVTGRSDVTASVTIIEYASKSSRKVVSSSTTRMHMVSTVDAQTNDQALLDRATVGFTGEVTETLSSRGGPLQGRRSQTTNVQGAATVNLPAMRAGAAQPWSLTSSSGTIKSRVDFLVPGLVDSVVDALAGENAAQSEERIADGLGNVVSRLRAIEKNMQTPNTCAVISYGSLLDEEHPGGEPFPLSIGIDHRARNVEVPGTFARIAVDLGQVDPETISPATTEGQVTVVPDSSAEPGKTNSKFTHRGTSRVGIAEREWRSIAPKTLTATIRFNGNGSTQESDTVTDSSGTTVYTQAFDWGWDGTWKGPVPESVASQRLDATAATLTGTAQGDHSRPGGHGYDCDGTIPSSGKPFPAFLERQSDGSLKVTTQYPFQIVSYKDQNPGMTCTTTGQAVAPSLILPNGDFTAHAREIFTIPAADVIAGKHIERPYSRAGQYPRTPGSCAQDHVCQQSLDATATITIDFAQG